MPKSKTKPRKQKEPGMEFRNASWKESLRMEHVWEAAQLAEAANREALLSTAAPALKKQFGIDIKAATRRQADAYNKVLESLEEFTREGESQK